MARGSTWITPSSRMRKTCRMEEPDIRSGCWRARERVHDIFFERTLNHVLRVDFFRGMLPVPRPGNAAARVETTLVARASG